MFVCGYQILVEHKQSEVSELEALCALMEENK